MKFFSVSVPLSLYIPVSLNSLVSLPANLNGQSLEKLYHIKATFSFCRKSIEDAKAPLYLLSWVVIL